MIKILLIGLGGAIGALGRYFVSGVAHKVFAHGFPWGTLSVNLIGSLIIGVLWGLLEGMTVAEELKLFIFMGVLGAFTTFSTFSLENFNLIREGQWQMVLVNVGVSVVVGIGLVFAGYYAAKGLVK